MATHSSILAWEILWTEGAGRATVHGVAKSRTRLSEQYSVGGYNHTYYSSPSFYLSRYNGRHSRSVRRIVIHSFNSYLAYRRIRVTFT